MVLLFERDDALVTQPAKSTPRSAIIQMSGESVTIYARGSKAAAALEELMADTSLYHGVKMFQVIEAVYEQGIRDGRRQVVEAFGEVAESKALAYRNPGRPAAKKTAAKKTAAKKAAAKKTAAKKTAAKKSG